MQKNRYFIFAFGVIILIAVVFRPNPGLSPSSSSRPIPSWLSDWIDTPLCNQACWDNLSPGKSRLMEARNSFGERSDIENYYESAGVLSRNQKAIYWHFTNSGGTGEIYTDLNGEFISTIILHTKSSLTVESIISKFGMPAEISVVSCLSEDGPVCEVRLLYLDLGLAVKFKTVPSFENSSTSNFFIDVPQNAEVTEIMLFPPGKNGYIEAAKNKIADTLERTQKWNEFGRYTFSNE